MPSQPTTEFEKKIVAQSPSHAALARRLVDDTLTSEERRAFTRTREMLRMRDEEELTSEEIGQRLGGMTASNVRSFMGRETFKVMSAFLRERELSTDPVLTLQRDRAERTRFERLGPRALDFLEACFGKNKKGEWESKADARWATQIVVKGKGWDEREEGRRNLGDIKIGVIVAQQQAIRQSDAKLHATAVVVEAGGQRVTAALPEPSSPAFAPELQDEDTEPEIDDVGMLEVPSPTPEP